MANIRITETKGAFTVTVDEYPEITFTESTYDSARDKAVMLVKEEIEKNAPKIHEAKETTRAKIGFGFAA